MAKNEITTAIERIQAFTKSEEEEQTLDNAQVRRLLEDCVSLFCNHQDGMVNGWTEEKEKAWLAEANQIITKYNIP